jgi:hypothetical protein
MSAPSGKSLRDHWIANTESLDKQGHFASYSPKQREEILKEGISWPVPAGSGDQDGQGAGGTGPWASHGEVQ